MDVFAKNIQARARALGRSNADVARAVGINERRYAHYATGAREPDMLTLLKIAEALGSSPNELLGFDRLETRSENLLPERLLMAARQLPPQDLESIVVQTEALLALRRFQSNVAAATRAVADRADGSAGA
ncbi:helix-turn-helix domain-containing protein [Aquabacter sp. P-9]|uniref:helix-turn-helix domain-containing protein n=1 Tax=Aquabacter sediminis TaxID=3029197 RepID=UPI00237D9743|nr:helix-turn-helix transcriptional regulator [Aquabacter sp. P-9]MDE1567872.1 helix-turn-helix transcriptional regulator [Aquabacter sp. P-9]